MLTIRENNWNVQVLGRWNRAILTPKGIADTLFGVESGEQVEVEIPFDGIAPPRVKHKGFAVWVDDNRMVVSVEDESNYERLEEAMTMAATGIAALPKTPLIAAGVNVHPADSDWPIPQAIESKWDDYLCQASTPPVSAQLSRTYDWNDGRITVTATQYADSSDYDVAFNFERRSSDPDDLQNWLAMPVTKMREEVERASSILFCKDSKK